MASDSPSRRILFLGILFLSTAMLGVLVGRTYNRRSSHPEVKSVGPDGQPIHSQARGESAVSHLIVQGDYQVDKETHSFCTLNADKAFQITWRAVPEVVLRIESFRGAGEYEGEIRVRATYTGEAYRTSKGTAKVSIQVSPAPTGSLVSGSFSSSEYKGESGKGTVSGSFERCPYDLTAPVAGL